MSIPYKIYISWSLIYLINHFLQPKKNIFPINKENPIDFIRK